MVAYREWRLGQGCPDVQTHAEAKMQLEPPATIFSMIKGVWKNNETAPLEDDDDNAVMTDTTQDYRPRWVLQYAELLR